MIDTVRTVSVHVPGAAKDEICNIYKDMEMSGVYKTNFNKRRV